MTDRVVLAIDGNSLVHRAFHAQAATAFRDATGRPAWAVRGLLSQLVAAVDRIRPHSVVVGFDDPDRNLRRETWPQYKAGRVEKLDTLVGQLALAVQVLRELGVHVVVPAGYEADDVLASVAATAPGTGDRTVIVTSDRDAFALIDEHTSVLRIINGGVEASPLLTPARLATMIGVRPDQYRDYAALRGDASDNLPGVRGIGPKTAARLLAAYGSARSAFDAPESHLTELVGAGVARLLAEPTARTAWELNCRVMAMRTDLELDLGGGQLPLDDQAVCAAFASLNLTWTARLARQVLAHVEGEAPEPRYAQAHDPGWPPRRSVRRPERSGRAVARKPVADQLALF